jgi:hypothetical protein
LSAWRNPLTHFSVTVAIDATVAAGDDLFAAVDAVLAPYDENLTVAPYIAVTRMQAESDEQFVTWWSEHQPGMDYAAAARCWWGDVVDEVGNIMSTSNPDAVWDWWVVGGRFAGEWVLTPGAVRALESCPSSFGYTDAIQNLNRTDAARKGEIEPESISPTYAFVDLDGKWHQQGRILWFGQSASERGERDWAAEYTHWFQALPADVWVVRVDAHV